MWDYTGNKVIPSVAKDWRLSDDGKVMHALSAQGHEVVGRAPFTADDFLFWYDDIYQNKDLVPTPAPEFTVSGKPGEVVRTRRLHRRCSSSRIRISSSSTSWRATR